MGGSCHVIVQFLSDSKDKYGTTASTPALDLRQQFQHVRRGHAIRRTTAEFLEDVLQLVASRNDDPHAHDAKLEEEPKVIEIAIEERVLIVPFDFEGDAILEAIDAVGRGSVGVRVDGDLG